MAGECIKDSSKPKLISVILNPLANGQKAKQLFDANVAPLLHLNGFQVQIFITDHEHEAKDLMSVIDKATVDYILIAGGDGTIQEVVTGLMRKKDEANCAAYQYIPIGILPLGYNNSYFRKMNNMSSEEIIDTKNSASFCKKSYVKT